MAKRRRKPNPDIYAPSHRTDPSSKSQHKSPTNPVKVMMMAAFSSASQQEVSLVDIPTQRGQYHQAVNLIATARHHDTKAVLLKKLGEDFPNNPFTVLRLAFFHKASGDDIKGEQAFDRAVQMAGRANISIRDVESTLTRGL